MSDFYDSLEDDSDGFRDSTDSLQKLKISTLPPSDDFEGSGQPSSHESFYLNEDVYKTPTSAGSLVTSRTIIPNECRRRSEDKICLPKIENNTSKGVSKVPLHVFIDNKALNKQGLQLNTDGSFTKSPRTESEKLPFVSPEYQNLQFKKKLANEGKKRVPPAKINRKNVFGFSEKSGNDVSMIELIRARKKKGSSEEVLTSGGSNASNSKYAASGNLTDSMKEMLLKQKSEKVKKVKRVINLLEISNKNTLCSRKNSMENQVKSGSQVWSNNQDKRTKILPTKTGRHQPDILASSIKPRLTYSERRLMENGFNPLVLRLGINKTPSETNRSNFGDSTTDKLSDISSRVPSCRGFTDEDEEAFYRNIIEKEKRELLKAQENAQLATSLGGKKQSGSSGSKTKKELTNSARHKRVSKSTSIDLPMEQNNCLQQSRKKSHYCSIDSSPPISKTELAMKARTYGYLVNARNIFKMKSQTDACSVSPKGESEKIKYGLALNSSICKTRYRNLSAKNTPKKGSDEVVLNLPKTSRSVCKAEQLAGYDIPLSSGHYQDNIRFGSEILRRINSCLNGSSFRVEDTLYHGLREGSNGRMKI